MFFIEAWGKVLSVDRVSVYVWGRGCVSTQRGRMVKELQMGMESRLTVCTTRPAPWAPQGPWTVVGWEQEELLRLRVLTKGIG